MDRSATLAWLALRPRALTGWAVALCLMAAMGLSAVGPGAQLAGAAALSSGAADPAGTVWLCRPGLAHDPCTENLSYTAVPASGPGKVVDAQPAKPNGFDCFYVYPTVSTEPGTNSDLQVQRPEQEVAFAQASRFSQVCRVWAPMYRQITDAGLAGLSNPVKAIAGALTAYHSIRSGFEDYLEHYNDGRPIVFIGHSQGAAMLILLLSHLVDTNAALRKRLVLAIILGGNVQVKNGSTLGGSFAHIPLCTQAAQAGCVIAYSSFPAEPPTTALFGRPGRGVSLLSGQLATAGVHVACVNPARIGGTGPLDTFVPSLGTAQTLWLEYDGEYTATCEQAGGATWLQVSRASSPDQRPAVLSEPEGPNWGYHPYDVNLALGNLVSDVAASEKTWAAGTEEGKMSHDHPTGRLSR